MKKTKLKRIVAAALALVVIISTNSLSALAWTIEGDGVTAKENATTFSQTLYMESLPYENGTIRYANGNFMINELPLSSLKKISCSIQSDKSVIELDRLYTQRLNLGKSFQCQGGFHGVKPGKATLTLKLGKKTITNKINILKYVNPIKVAENTKDKVNFASKYKKENIYCTEWKSSKKAYTGKIKFSTNKNWYITGASVDVMDQDNYQRISYDEYKYNNKTSVTIPYSKINGNCRLTVTLKLYNASTKGYQRIIYFINKPQR